MKVKIIDEVQISPERQTLTRTKSTKSGRRLRRECEEHKCVSSFHTLSISASQPVSAEPLERVRERKAKRVFPTFSAGMIAPNSFLSESIRRFLHRVGRQLHFASSAYHDLSSFEALLPPEVNKPRQTQQRKFSFPDWHSNRLQGRTHVRPADRPPRAATRKWAVWDDARNGGGLLLPAAATAAMAATGKGAVATGQDHRPRPR